MAGKVIVPVCGEQGEKIYRIVKEYTGTGLLKVLELVSMVRWIVNSDVPGDFVECGVWRGGSVMAMALALMELGEERDIWLYDTFEGMTEPQEIDGRRARRKWEENKNWCYCPIKEVRANVRSVGYPRHRFHFVRGRVEETIPLIMPEKIALLRLDTDWYSSTKHELIHLYPLLSVGGALFIDDYGHWPGVRIAVEECIPDFVFERVGRAAFGCKV